MRFRSVGGLECQGLGLEGFSGFNCLWLQLKILKL